MFRSLNSTKEAEVNIKPGTLFGSGVNLNYSAISGNIYQITEFLQIYVQQVESAVDRFNLIENM